MQSNFQALGLIIGLIIASFSAMQFIFSPIWGRLSDRYGRRPAILLGLGMSMVFLGFGHPAAGLQCDRQVPEGQKIFRFRSQDMAQHAFGRRQVAMAPVDGGGRRLAPPAELLEHGLGQPRHVAPPRPQRDQLRQALASHEFLHRILRQIEQQAEAAKG